MIAEKMRYYKGSIDKFETIELDKVRSDGTYVTTCVVNVQLLTAGVKTYPCGNGDDFKLSPDLYLRVLEFLQEQRKAVINSFPHKTYKSWQESGLPTFEDYFQPGDEVDGELVDYFVNSLPPVLYCSFCTQAGEAYSTAFNERTGRQENTYTTFHLISKSRWHFDGTKYIRTGEDRWKFDGYCFFRENVNRETGPSRLEQMIEEARREVVRT